MGVMFEPAEARLRLNSHDFLIANRSRDKRTTLQTDYT
jgi:hypothetical protein